MDRVDGRRGKEEGDGTQKAGRLFNANSTVPRPPKVLHMHMKHHIPSPVCTAALPLAEQ
jgi:hypothetical protein